MGILASRDGAIWVANDGSLDRISNGTVSSIRRSDGLPGDQVTSLLEDRAGNMWVGVDDRLFLFKDGRFRRLPEPNHEPLGMVVGMAEDIDGNIWAECASKPRKLVRVRDFRVQEQFPEALLLVFVIAPALILMVALDLLHYLDRLQSEIGIGFARRA